MICHTNKSDIRDLSCCSKCLMPSSFDDTYSLQDHLCELMMNSVDYNTNIYVEVVYMI